VFHLLLHGQCDITPEGEQSPHTLQESDIFFIARRVEHVIQSIDVDHAENLPAKEYALTNGLRVDATGVLCGTFECDENVRNPLLDALPSSIVVKTDVHSDPNWMKHLIALLVAESDHDSVGSNILVEQLVDTFFIHIFRSYLMLG